MNDPNADINDARKLEENKFMQWVSEAAKRREIEIRALKMDAAARGGAVSGGLLIAESNLIFDSIERVADKVIMYRQELGARIPALLTQAELCKLQDKLNRYVDGGIKGLRTRSTLQPRGVTAGLVIQDAQQRAHSVKVALNHKFAALPLEARLGLNCAGEPKVTTFNISNSTIANLNLGNVVGDLNSSIQHLNVEGHNELAEGFKKMTEAIASSRDLGDDARKGLLEHLAMVSEEAAKPVERRKNGPLKMSIDAIKSGLDPILFT